MSNACERCGGLKNFYFEVTPIYHSDSTISAVLPSTFKMCMCSPVQEKHDGKLGGQFDTRVAYAGGDVLSEVVVLSDECGTMPLTSVQALSLLAWLKQEQDILEKFAEGEKARASRDQGQ